MSILSKTLTVDEILTWKFHWILSDLWDLKGRIDQHYPSYNGGHTSERIAEYIDQVCSAKDKYQKVITEVSRMIRLDYRSDLEEVLSENRKYCEFRDELENMMNFVMDIRDTYQAKERLKIENLFDRSRLK